jgi:hypothetical protein
MWFPSDRALYKLLTDWGGVIGGVFALIAGLIAYWAGQIQAAATLKAAHDQIAMNAHKDRVQAHAVAAAIYPEIVKVENSVKDARSVSHRVLTPQLIREAKVYEPPLIREMADQLFIIGPSGATSLQLLSVILQYNDFIEKIAVKLDPVDVDLPNSLGPLWGLLDVMERLVVGVLKEIKPIHDDVIRP